jgi:hypothetical protein
VGYIGHRLQSEGVLETSELTVCLTKFGCLGGPEGPGPAPAWGERKRGQQERRDSGFGLNPRAPGLDGPHPPLVFLYSDLKTVGRADT